MTLFCKFRTGFRRYIQLNVRRYITLISRLNSANNNKESETRWRPSWEIVALYKIPGNHKCVSLYTWTLTMNSLNGDISVSLSCSLYIFYNISITLQFNTIKPFSTSISACSRPTLRSRWKRLKSQWEGTFVAVQDTDQFSTRSNLSPLTRALIWRRKLEKLR